MKTSEIVKEEDEPLTQACMDITYTKIKTLVDCATKSSKRLFNILRVSDNILEWTYKLGMKMKILGLLMKLFPP